jgi:predicted ABC-type transport system involved in lysophospholipase L1 biosynthesis ATPase subunit
MSETNNVLVRIQDVDKLFRRGSEEIHVLGGLDLEMPEGEFLALMGPSGSGKSTLLNLIGGLDRPSEGSVEVGGLRLDRLSDRKLAGWRARHVELVFQFYNMPCCCRARYRRPDPTRQALPAAALGWRAAANRYRPRDRHGPHDPALRRAHR